MFSCLLYGLSSSVCLAHTNRFSLLITSFSAVFAFLFTPVPIKENYECNSLFISLLYNLFRSCRLSPIRTETQGILVNTPQTTVAINEIVPTGSTIPPYYYLDYRVNWRSKHWLGQSFARFCLHRRVICLSMFCNKYKMMEEFRTEVVSPNSTALLPKFTLVNLLTCLERSLGMQTQAIKNVENLQFISDVERFNSRLNAPSLTAGGRRIPANIFDAPALESPIFTGT